MKGWLSVLVLAFAVGCGRAQSRASGLSGKVEPFVSQAKWVYCGSFDNPATNCYMRLAFDLTKNVRRATLRMHIEKGGGRVWVNGEEVKPRLWEPGRAHFGHVKASEVNLLGKLRRGRNVVAVRTNDCTVRNTCRGAIMRGEIEFEDGSVLPLASNAGSIVAVPEEVGGWTAVDFDDSSWPRAIEIGDVFQPPWSRWGRLPESFCMGEELQAYHDWIERERARLAQSSLVREPESPNARIVYSGDIPGIEVNGRAFPPVIDMHLELADSPERRTTLSNMRKAGVRFISIEGINRFRVAEGKYDFEMLDLQMMQILQVYPEAYFFFSYGSGVYNSEWARLHPDECVEFAVQNKESNIYNYNCSKPAPSFASKLYRERGVADIMAFGKYVRSRPWGRRVVGFWTAFGGSGDGMPAGCYAVPDSGVAMTRAFRRYLGEKYKTDAALQDSWGDPSVTLETAKVPGKVERDGWGGFIKDRSDPRDRRADDYYDCYHKEFSDYIMTLGKAVKDALPGRLSGAYHGYVVLSYNPEGSTARCEEILRSPYVDMLFATTRGYNLTDGLHRNLHSLCRRYGKLSTIEGDIRTHLCYRHGQSMAHWSCKSPEETRSTYSKIVANSFMYGSGYHIVGFNGYTNINSKLVWTDCPETLEPIAAGVKAWEKIFAAPPKKTADIAVVLDPDEVWRDGHPSYWPSARMADNLVVYALQSLNFSGYAYDMMSPVDFVDSRHDYKAVVFLNLFNVKPEIRAKLVAKLQRKGVTAIWQYAPGIQTEDGYSARSMSELTGINMGFRKEILSPVATGDGGAVYRFWNVPTGYKDGPRAFADDPKAKVLAWWSDDGKPALVQKDLPSGARSIFCGVPVRNSVQWGKFFKEAGCHAFTKPGFLVRRNSKLLEVFSGKNCTIPPESEVQRGQIDQSGVCEVKLERRFRLILDVLTSEVVGQNTDRITLKAGKPHLWLLETR